MPRRHQPRQFANQKARDKFVSDVRIAILRLGTASQIRDRFPIGLESELKKVIHPYYLTYSESLSNPASYDDWCDENIPAIVEEILNTED